MRRLSQRLSQGKGKGKGGKEKGSLRADELAFHSFNEGEEAWVGDAKHQHEWERATVLAQAGVFVTVRYKNKKKPEQIDARQRGVYPTNPSVQSDMTALYHINEPCILYNLQQRSYENEPYTFMGNVLVAVNPLKRIADPDGALGSKKATMFPHPFAIAEFAFQQMSFASDNRKKREADIIIDQSVVTSGESGAGKTESSKMVLRHLVQRTAQDGHSKKMSEIDRRLLESNVITEAFGNATTLRNGNSSRFGKFMKLHFSQVDTPRGEPAKWKISAASVETYLLERSRVTLHEKGERNYHSFYLMLQGMDSGHEKRLHLDIGKKHGFRYCAPLESTTSIDVSAGLTKKEFRKDDADRFVELRSAMEATGFSESEMMEVWKVVAGVLHLGNIVFDDFEDEEGDIAKIMAIAHDYEPLACAADVLGVDMESLEELLTERVINTRDGSIVVHRNADASSFARDAVAKGIYSVLFDHVVNRINEALDETAHGVDRGDLPFIGVLDIFGFESFEKNGFEQLLINFTNESLQSTFNKKVFQAELSLYKKEGLVVDGTMTLPPGNEGTMELLAGKLKNPDSDDARREDKDAVLVDLDQHCGEMQPSDVKLLKIFNRKFKDHPNFPKVHPKFAHEIFMIKHYAGTVSYTIGQFVEKNDDSLPKEVNEILSKSKCPILADAFSVLLREEEANTSRGKKKVRSIVRGFRAQIIELTNTLDATACSFIRCVKPNSSMKRGNNNAWFDNAYVGHQLKHLSIPQTAMVLRSGLPTRISYSSLVDSYMKVLPEDATKRFRAQGKNINVKLFVQALFWAFEIDPTIYKLGFTKVFFKAGQIAELDKILSNASAWSSGDKKSEKEKKKVVKRFRKYYARSLWRRGFAKARAIVKFTKILDQLRAAIKIQAIARMYIARRDYLFGLERKHELEEISRKQEEEEKKREAELERLAEEEHVKLLKEMERQKTLTKSRAQEEVEEEMPQDEEDDKEIRAREASKAMKRIGTTRLHAYAEDEIPEYDEDSEDDQLSEGLPTPDFSEHEETEEERRTRIAQEIQADAEIATDKKVRELEANGAKVTSEMRQNISEEYEREYSVLMAKFEARRQRNEAFKEEVSQFWVSVKNGVVHHTRNLFRHTSAFWLWVAEKGLQKVPEKQKETTWFQKVSEFNSNMQEMLKTVKGHKSMENVKETIANKEVQGAEKQQLRKQQTMTGPVLKVNQTELRAPVESGKKQVRAMAELVKKGDLSPDEMAAMIRDLDRHLNRESSRKYSADSEATFLNPQTNDHTVLPPAQDQWMGAPLACKGGYFYIKMEDKLRKEFNMRTQESDEFFTFSCGWQSNSGNDVGRWAVTLTLEEVVELRKALVKHKKKLFKSKNVPELPERRGGQVRKKKTARDATRLKMEPPKLKRHESNSQMKQKEFVGHLQDWFESMVEDLSVPKGHKSQKTHPVFKDGHFDYFFDVNENVEEIKDI